MYPLFESAAFIFANSESKVCGDYNKLGENKVPPLTKIKILRNTDFFEYCQFPAVRRTEVPNNVYSPPTIIQNKFFVYILYTRKIRNLKAKCEIEADI
jgi:hypothetical protein